MRVTSKPANEKARGIDSDGSPYTYRLLRYEQCLERSEETTSFGTREARMALAAHRASHWCTSRNSRRLPEGGGDRGTRSEERRVGKECRYGGGWDDYKKRERAAKERE